MRTLLTVVSIGVSAALLWRSLRKGRMPAVVRQVLDVARGVLQASAVIAIMVITGVRTSPALLLIAIGVGLLAGFSVGSTLLLELRERRIAARRSLIGATVWGAGLVAAQLAGIANRAGVFRVGQAISWFGVAAAVGTFAGRGPRLGELRRQVAVGTLAATAALVVLLAAAYPTDQRAAAAPDGGTWVLADTHVDPMDGFTTMSHTPGAVTATISAEGYQADFQATYDVPPAELSPGTDLRIDVHASASVSGTVQQFSALEVIQLTESGWTGEAVSVGVFCQDPVGEQPLYCSGPDSSSGSFTWAIPTPTTGDQYIIGVGLLNCSCAILWIYEPSGVTFVDGGGGDGGVGGGFEPDGVSTPTGSSDASAHGGEHPDDETISDDEALGSSIAVLIIAVLIGLVDLAEVPLGPPGTASADGASSALPPPVAPTAPPDPELIDKLADQADAWAVDAIVGGIDFDTVDDQIAAIRARARAGTSLAGDEELLRAIRDALWAIGQRNRAGIAATEQQNAAVLGALETLMGIEMEFGKAAAGTFGPTSATLYAGLVETLANRDKGMANALGHGAVGGAAALVGSRAAPALDRLGGAMGIVRAGARNAAENAAEDVGHQLVDSGGDVSQIDPMRTAGAATTGFVTGAGAHVVTPAVRGSLPTPPVRGGDLSAPGSRAGGAAPDGAPAAPPTAPRGSDLPPPPPRPAGPPPPPVLDSDAPYVPGPAPDTTIAPTDVFGAPPRVAPPQPAHLDTGGAPADLFPGSPELPASPRVRLQQDAAGNYVDPGGNPLFRMTPQGPHDLDGNRIERFIFDRDQRVIGYERADGVQVISSANYDGAAFDTVSGRSVDPGELPPTGQQPQQ